MKIAYVTHARFPTEKAHGKQMAEVCGALADNGHNVTLICPRVRNNIFESAAEYYDLPDNFDVRYLHHFDGTAHWWIPGIARFAVTMFFYRRAVKRFLASQKFDLLYARSILLLPSLVQHKMRVIAELHTLPTRFNKRLVSALNKCVLVVSLTTPMKDAIVELGVNADKIIVEGDGVLLRRFISPENAQLIKDKYALPMDRKILGYVGSLITRNTIEKGIFEMLEAISILRKQNLPVCGFIVGGPKSWKLRYMKIARSLELTDKDIIFYDRVSSGQIASILHACDLLIYPAPKSSHPYFIRDTSPLKLFEYLASGKPIVCADILPIRDVVNEESVSLVPSGDSIAMASAIKKNLFETMSDTNEKKNKRLQLAQWYDWHSRMERILSRARQ